MRIIDATGLVLGRLGSHVAQLVLSGEEVRVVNAEKAVISGSKEKTFEEYKKKIDRGSREKGPYYPRRPDQIIKRTIRGMVPRKKKRGREALSRLKVYIGVPEELEGEDFETLEEAHVTNLSTIKYIELEELSKKLGARW